LDFEPRARRERSEPDWQYSDIRCDLGQASNAACGSKDCGPGGCDENGPAPALLVGHRSMSDMLRPRASAAGHFDRNGVPNSSVTVH
jgi:hypothetical protein